MDSTPPEATTLTPPYVVPFTAATTTARTTTTSTVFPSLPVIKPILSTEGSSSKHSPLVIPLSSSFFAEICPDGSESLGECSLQRECQTLNRLSMCIFRKCCPSWKLPCVWEVMEPRSG